MSRNRRLFGPMLWGTLSLAVLAIGGLNVWERLPTWRQYQELRGLAGDLRSPDQLVNWQAASGLTRAGAAGVPWLVRATRDPHAGVRLRAFTAVGRTLPLPKPALGALVGGLRDDDLRIRREAAGALGRFGPEAASAASGLAAAMGDDDPDVRFRAARALARVEGGSSESALVALLGCIADPVGSHLPGRAEAIPIIRRMGPPAEARAVAALIPLVDAGDPLARRGAIECLEQLGPSAHDAIPALDRASRGDDPIARCLAALALSEIEGWEQGRALALLRDLDGSPALPTGMRTRVRWVASADLIGGSEMSQPVHTLRALLVGHLACLWL